MLCIKLFSLFVIILCLMPEQSQVSATFWLNGCFLKLCYNYESTVYASDGNNCLVYRNSCHLSNDNCRRRRANAPSNYWRIGIKRNSCFKYKFLHLDLSIVTKEACQAKCTKDCGTEKVPVCGEYAGVYTTFDNNCELLKTACVNGQCKLFSFGVNI